MDEDGDSEEEAARVGKEIYANSWILPARQSYVTVSWSLLMMMSAAADLDFDFLQPCLRRQRKERALSRQYQGLEQRMGHEHDRSIRGGILEQMHHLGWEV